MPTQCTHPLTAWKEKTTNSTPKPYLFCLPEPEIINQYETVPSRCRKCDGCIAYRAQQWSVRCALEMRMHDQNCFFTLTYADVGENPTLNPDDITKFVKRLRKKVAKDNNNQKIRIIQCGEYGEQQQRPHHHVIVFGYDFPDKGKIGQTSSGIDKFHSQILTDLWGHGFTMLQEANMGAARYLAGYVSKKIYGTKDPLTGRYISGGSKNTHYTKVNQETGEIYQVHKEYMTMSNNPGIGYPFYEQFKTDLFPKGTVHIMDKSGKTSSWPVPDYFYRKLAEDDPKLYLQSIKLREERGIQYQLDHPDESTIERRRDKDKHAKLIKQTSALKGRGLGADTPNTFTADMAETERNLINEQDYEIRLEEQAAFEQKFKGRLQSKTTQT